MFNLSVAITDKFIQAVKNDEEWPLVFEGAVHKTIRASHLWDLIMRSTYDFAEPGFILIDKIKEMNNLYYCEEIRATNPCGEQPLPPYGACLLGSVNLTRFVKDPFTSKAKVKYKELEKVVKVATRMLDNVIDVSNYPMEVQKHEAQSKRRMGLGVTGLADLFIFLGVKYGSQESLEITKKIMQTITNTAYRTSIELGQEKGVFAKFDAELYSEGKFIKSLPKDIQSDIRKHGLRNSHLTSIAPTGTISLFAGNVSSGLEPVFAFHYNRKIRNTSEEDVTEVEVVDYAYQKYREYLNVEHIDDNDLPNFFVSSATISADEHLNIQAVLQEYVDSSISKTINVPSDYPFEDFKNIYMKAYDKGLKGCTTFRPSEYIAGVLSTGDEKKKDEKKEEKVLEKSQRPKELEGTTYQIKTPLSSDALYVTINDLINQDGTRRPYELFINTKNLQHFSWIVAMTRLISAVFRHQTNPAYLVDELKSIYDPNGGYYNEGKYVPSLVADIGRIIEQHLRKIGLIEEQVSNKKFVETKKQEDDQSGLMICPECNEKALLNQENCLKCLSCGYSKCG
jgi:ribonucleoside-diphosphate reductase alpha chain